MRSPTDAPRTVVRVQLLSVQLGLEDRELPAGYSPADEVAALANTLEQLDLDAPMDVTAWSYGVDVALTLALEHPALVRTLTLIEPAAYWVLPSPTAEERAVRDRDRAFGNGPITEDDLETFLVDAGLAPPGASVRDLPQWPTWVEHRRSLRAIRAIWDHVVDRERLPAMTAPTLLVKGTDSVPYAHRVVDTLADRLPHAEVAEWPGGHAPHLVSTEPFLARMAALQATAGAP